MIYNFSNILDNIERLVPPPGKAPDGQSGWMLEEFLAYAEYRYKLWLDGMLKLRPEFRKHFYPPW